MITRTKIQLILFVIFITFNVYGQNKEFSKNSVKVGIGLGASMGNNTEGFGIVYTMGYQREIWKDRLRLNPNFSIGHYSSGFILDSRYQYFNSINIETNLYYDLIKIESFSIVVGCGGIVNNSKGLKGLGGDSEAYTLTTYPKYVSDFHFGAYLGGGFRINSPNKRTAINIMPINLHIGNNYFGELHAKIELDFKF